MSYTTLRDFYRDAFHLKVSTGFLAKQVRKVSDALKQPYETLVAKLPEEEHLHSDETGGKENGKKRWTWCFRAKDYTVFHVCSSRGSAVLEEHLGNDYSGIISSDFFSAYRKFQRLSQSGFQYCWSHVIREVKYFASYPVKKVSRWGGRLLAEIRKMFRVFHRLEEFRLAQDVKSEQRWLRKLHACKESLLWSAWYRLPAHKDVCTLAERLWNCQEDYFRFMESGVPPTNNLCEQSIRRVVIDRKITQGTRSDWGNRWSERIWTMLATCDQRRENVMECLQAWVRTFLQGYSPPEMKKP